MYLPLVATESGRINFTVPEGSILESGAIVATFQLDDPSKVRTAELYEGEVPTMKAPRVKGKKRLFFFPFLVYYHAFYLLRGRDRKY